MKNLIMALGLVAFGSVAHAEVAGATRSAQENFQIVLEVDPSTLPLNEFVELKVMVYDAADALVPNATISIGGGMPGHGHGLPTSPEVRSNADGSYVVEGLKFSMPGQWVLVFDILANGTSDSATVEFGL